MPDPIQLKFRRLHPAAKLPTKARDGDAAFDLYAPEENHVWGRGVVPLGIAWECPLGWYAQIVGRSGLARSHGVIIMGGAIDAGYRGEWVVLLTTGNAPWNYAAGDRIAQFVLLPVPSVEIIESADLASSERGEGGLGSTGR